MVWREAIEDPAAAEVFGPCAVPVKQHDRRSGARLDIVQPDAVHLDETAGRGVLGFRTPRSVSNDHRDEREDRKNDRDHADSERQAFPRHRHATSDWLRVGAFFWFNIFFSSV